MVINKIKVSDNFTHFTEAFTYEGKRRGINLDDYRLEDIYTHVAEACFQRYLGESFGDIIEYIANSINLTDDAGGVETDNEAYMLIYENSDIVEDLYTRLKYNGNSLFRGDGYGENIHISLEFIDSEAYIVFNTNIPLFNTPLFTTTDGSVTDKVDLTLELETEFIIFKSVFKNYLSDSFSHNSSEIDVNDYITLFAGLAELCIMYDDLVTNIDDIVDSLNQLFDDTLESLDPNDMNLYGSFYLNHTDYINRLYTYIISKTKHNFDIISWGVLGDKVMLGLKERR